MKYRKIETELWGDEKFRNLSKDAQYLFFYLLTSPHSNSLGIFKLPQFYVAGDTKLLPERLPELFAELFAIQLVEYDEKTSVVWIKNFLRHNPIQNQNQAKYAEKCIKNTPKNPYSVMVSKLLPKPFHKRLAELLRERFREPWSIEHGALSIEHGKEKSKEGPKKTSASPKSSPKPKKQKSPPKEPVIFSEAVSVYRDIIQKTPDELGRGLIDDKIKPQDIHQWRKIVTEWKVAKHNPFNIPGMLDKFIKIYQPYGHPPPPAQPPTLERREAVRENSVRAEIAEKIRIYGEPTEEMWQQAKKELPKAKMIDQMRLAIKYRVTAYREEHRGQGGEILAKLLEAAK